MISWADMERDLSAWLGNAMPSPTPLARALQAEGSLKEKGDEQLLTDCGGTDHERSFYYMCTKLLVGRGCSQIYFSPVRSPYDSYIQFHECAGQYPDAAAGREDEKQLHSGLPRLNSGIHSVTDDLLNRVIDLLG